MGTWFVRINIRVYVYLYIICMYVIERGFVRINIHVYVYLYIICIYVIERGVRSNPPNPPGYGPGVCTTPVNTHNEVHVMDSLASGSKSLNHSLELQIAKVYGMGSSNLKIELLSVQQQDGKLDCGLLQWPLP